MSFESEQEQLLGTVQIEDVPPQDARGFEAFGVVGQIEQKAVKNNKVMVSVPLTYRREGQTEARTTYARLFIHPRWLTPEFQATAKGNPESIDEKELISYNINVRGLYRGLFVAAGIEDGASDLKRVTGQVVGFVFKPQKNDPSRLQISRFFPPPQ